MQNQEPAGPMASNGHLITEISSYPLTHERSPAVGLDKFIPQPGV